VPVLAFYVARDAEPSRKERGHQRCEAAPPKS
jgi:hypothetical protein